MRAQNRFRSVCSARRGSFRWAFNYHFNAVKLLFSFYRTQFYFISMTHSSNDTFVNMNKTRRNSFDVEFPRARHGRYFFHFIHRPTVPEVVKSSNSLAVEPYPSQWHHRYILRSEANRVNCFMIQCDTKVSENGDQAQAGLKHTEPQSHTISRPFTYNQALVV